MTAQHRNASASARPRMVTIREVASAAGVGTTTVSRALNNSGYVAADVRARVLESARRLGYRPSAPARSMRSQRTMTLGVVLPELVNPVYLDFLRGVEEVADRHGYVTVIGSSHHDPERESAILDRMVSERVDGLIVGRIDVDQRIMRGIRAQGIAVVPSPGAAAKRMDAKWEASESAATEQMARRLVELGHRRVVIVTFDEDAVQAPPHARRSRVHVIKTVMAEAGARLRHVGVPRGGDLADSAPIISAALSSAARPTAVVASNHLIAPAALLAIRLAGLTVPGDVSFVSYGDSAWAKAYAPAVSVIRHDTHREATQMTEMLLDHIANGSSRKTVDYHAEFVERESCGPARARR